MPARALRCRVVSGTIYELASTSLPRSLSCLVSRSPLGFAVVPVCLAVCVAVMPAQRPKDTNPPWAEELLKEAKLTPAKAQLDPNRWTGGGPHRLNTFQKLWDDWREIDPTARTAAKDFLAAADSFEKLVTTGAPYLDVKPPIAPGAAGKSSRG